jgi:hypothetical protein
MLDQISEVLPNFPEEVIEQWLLPFAEDEGWPPTTQELLSNLVFGKIQLSDIPVGFTLCQ